MENNANNNAINIKVTLFKDTGKYYTEETVNIPNEPGKALQVFQVTDWLRANYKNYKNMHLVAMLDEMPNGYPIMIPANERG